MDADSLRLILIFLGSLVLVGLFVWERRRESARYEDEAEDDYLDEYEREPSLGALQGQAGEDDATMSHRDAGEGIDEDILFRPIGGSDEPVAEEASGPLILQLNVAAVEGPFDGAEIVRAAEDCGLEPGEMDIFHHYREGGSSNDILFSMANVVNPGTFPFGAMGEFESPGLTLFAQAQGAPDDPERLEVMLATAYCLADALDGEAQDERRIPLSLDKELQLRERVAFYVERHQSS